MAELGDLTVKLRVLIEPWIKFFEDDYLIYDQVKGLITRLEFTPIDSPQSKSSDNDLIERDISHELWREYQWSADGQERTYRISAPRTLYFRKGSETHRIVDVRGVAHCVPSPGRFGCVLRWQNPAGYKPVRF